MTIHRTDDDQQMTINRTPKYVRRKDCSKLGYSKRKQQEKNELCLLLEGKNLECESWLGVETAIPRS